VAQRWSAGWGEFALYLGGGVLLLLVCAGALLVAGPFSAEERGTLRRALRRS
jgi:hypothetical protein